MMRFSRLLLFVVIATAACRDDQSGRVDTSRADAGTVTDSASPPDLAATVERLMPAVERVSGLDRREPLRVRRQTVEGARAYVESRLEQEVPAPMRDAIRRTYAALGLIPDTLDLDAMLLELYTEQVLGYYDPGERTLFIVSGQDVDEIQVIAHELVHALQDQYVDLDSLISGDRHNDRRTAAHAAMEGHAMIVMFTLLAEQATGRSVDPASLPAPIMDANAAIESNSPDFPVFRSAPRVVRETMLFPYTGGANFVQALWRDLAPRDRYPAPIDTLLPHSTEQVMRPEARFIEYRDEPLNVALGPAPAGWEVLHEDDFGQLETAIFLGHHLGERARSAADGWDGDRYALLSSPDGAEVIHWVSAWDTPADATRFAQAIVRAAELRTGRDVVVLREQAGSQSAVRVIDAPAGTDVAPLVSRE